MIHVDELDGLSRGRLDDARVLLEATRLDGAIYLAGYAIELALKARICRTLKWDGYMSTKGEFDRLNSFRTHDLDVLLRLSGQEPRIKRDHFEDWNAVATWRAEARYNAMGTASLEDARRMMEAAERLLGIL